MPQGAYEQAPPGKGPRPRQVGGDFSQPPWRQGAYEPAPPGKGPRPRQVYRLVTTSMENVYSLHGGCASSMEDVPSPWRMCRFCGEGCQAPGASSPRKIKVVAGVRPLGRVTGTCAPPRNGRPRVPAARGAGDRASPGSSSETWGRLLPGPWAKSPRKKKLLRFSRNLVGRWAGVWGGVP